jgi:hypothetical protein
VSPNQIKSNLGFSQENTLLPFSAQQNRAINVNLAAKFEYYCHLKKFNAVFVAHPKFFPQTLVYVGHKATQFTFSS